jgi:hypothetical protein
MTAVAARATYFNRFPPQDEESFRSLSEKSRELVHQNMLDLVGLLDLDADSDAVDTWFDEYFLVVVAGHG